MFCLSSGAFLFLIRIQTKSSVYELLMLYRIFRIYSDPSDSLDRYSFSESLNWLCFGQGVGVLLQWKGVNSGDGFLRRQRCRPIFCMLHCFQRSHCKVASIHKKLEHPRNPEVRAASGSRQKCLDRICETISVNTGDTLPDAGHPLGSVRDPQALQALRRDVQQDRVLGRYPASCNEASFSWVDVKAKS